MGFWGFGSITSHLCPTWCLPKVEGALINIDQVPPLDNEFSHLLADLLLLFKDIILVGQLTRVGVLRLAVADLILPVQLRN